MNTPKNKRAERAHHHSAHATAHASQHAHHTAAHVHASPHHHAHPTPGHHVIHHPAAHAHHSADRTAVELLESYTVEADGAHVKINIKREFLGTRYELHLPSLDDATMQRLHDIRNELVAITAVSSKELTDIEAFAAIKQRFRDEAVTLIHRHMPAASDERRAYLVGYLLQEMLGLGPIEFLINDPALEEVVITSAKEPVRVYSKKYGWLSTNIAIAHEEDIVNDANTIARRVGRQITVLNPLLDAHLVTGDRINAVLYPINTKGNTITIRKFARDPYTIVDMITNKTCTPEIAALLWLAIEYEMNILISGGTASGKTSFMNACLHFIPPNQRLISIEDTRELMLPDFLYWTPLVTRLPNPEGKGEVSMLDLLINSLRMRPDRIILGEMRKQEEATVLFEAMHTGHSVYATVHADSSAETISRLVNPPLNVPPNLLKAVNLNVVMFRDRKKQIRRVFQIAEIKVEKNEAQPNLLYRWVPEEDTMVQHSESSLFFEELARHTGMSQAEINRDLEQKKHILLWMIRNSLRSLNELGKLMNLYYRNRPALLHAITNNDKDAILAL